MELPSPLTIAIYFRELGSLDPLRRLLEQEGVEVRGKAHLSLAPRGALKVITLGRRLRRTIDLDQQVKCDILTHPLARAVAAQVLNELADPTSVLGTRWVGQHLELQSLVRRGKDLEPGIVSLTTHYRLVGKDASEMSDESLQGVGFFISPDLVLAPKRMVHPWRFDPEASYLLEHGYRLPRDGARLEAQGRRGFEIEKLAPDDVVTETHEVAGAAVAVQVHRLDSPRGLALLSARGKEARGQPLPALALQPTDALLVGIVWFQDSIESGDAPVLQTGWALATVTKDGVVLDRSFPESAVGAPVFDRDGNVRAVFLGRTHCVAIQAVDDLAKGIMRAEK